jgi:hypothetical protein
MDTIGTIAELSRATWRKSSYSTGNSECVEVGHVATWRKSSRSTANGSACVEVGDAGRAVAVRDSKDPDGPSLLVSPTAWLTFTGKIKSARLPGHRGERPFA